MRHAFSLSRLLLVVALVLLGGADAFVATARASDEEELKKYWRYFEITIGFTTEGRDLEARATLGCRPYLSKRPSGTRVQYEIEVPWIAKRLPSGAAVLFPAPGGLCVKSTYADRATGSIRLRSPFRSSYLPITFWLDDANSPSLIEEYVSETYYSGRSPRLKIRSFSVEPTGAGPITNPADEVAWLASDPPQGAFVGFYSTVVPKGSWSAVPEVADIIRTLTPGRNLTRKQHVEISRSITAWTKGTDKYSLGLGVPVEGQPLPPGYTASAYLANLRVHPIILRAGRYELDVERTGLIVHYPTALIPDGATPMNLRWLQFILGGQQVTAPTTLWQYDSNMETLFDIEPGGIGPCMGCSIRPTRARPAPAR